MAPETMEKNPQEIPNGQKKRASKGKQPIEIKLIECKNSRQVTFSKRRKGLFKKLAELCTDPRHSGTEAAIIAISGSGKLHSYGHPNVDAVIQRYTSYLNFKSVLEASKSSSVSHHRDKNNSHCGGFWWDEPADNLGLIELEKFKVSLEGLRNGVSSRIDEIACRSTSNVDENFVFGGMGGRSGVQINDFEFKNKENNVITPEHVRPELLPPDAYLNYISIKGFV